MEGKAIDITPSKDLTWIQLVLFLKRQIDDMNLVKSIMDNIVLKIGCFQCGYKEETNKSYSDICPACAPIWTFKQPIPKVQKRFVARSDFYYVIRPTLQRTPNPKFNNKNMPIAIDCCCYPDSD